MVETKSDPQIENLTSIDDHFRWLAKMLGSIEAKNQERLRLRKKLLNESTNDTLALLNQMDAVRGTPAYIEKILDVLRAKGNLDPEFSGQIQSVVTSGSSHPVAMRALSIISSFPWKRVKNHFDNHGERYDQILGQSKNGLDLRSLELKKKFQRVATKLEESQGFVEGLKNQAINLLKSQAPAMQIVKQIRYIVHKVDEQMGSVIKTVRGGRDVEPFMRFALLADELQDLENMKKTIHASLEEKDWQAFRKIYREASSTIARRYVRYFADRETATKLTGMSLKRSKHYIGYDPDKWTEELDKLKAEIWAKVDQLRIDALHYADQFFDTVTNEGEKTTLDHVEEIRKDARSIIKQNSNSDKERVVKDAIANRRKKVQKAIQLLRKKYLKSEKAEFRKVMAFWQLVTRVQNIWKRRGVMESTIALQKGYTSKMGNLKIAGQRMGKYGAQYDISLHSYLLQGVASLRADEDEMFRSQQLIGQTLLDFRDEINQAYKEAEESLSQLLTELRNEVK